MFTEQVDIKCLHELHMFLNILSGAPWAKCYQSEHWLGLKDTLV